MHKHRSVQWGTILVIAQIGNSQSMFVLSRVQISRLNCLCKKNSDSKFPDLWITKVSKNAILVIYNWKMVICSSTAFLNLGIFIICKIYLCLTHFNSLFSNKHICVSFWQTFSNSHSFFCHHWGEKNSN